MADPLFVMADLIGHPSRPGASFRTASQYKMLSHFKLSRRGTAPGRG